jgi:hypothetical protein
MAPQERTEEEYERFLYAIDVQSKKIDQHNDQTDHGKEQPASGFGRQMIGDGDENGPEIEKLPEYFGPY